MSKKEDDFIYDEDDSVKYIRNYLPVDLKDKFSDDDINYIVDLMYEFYESKGYLDENKAEDELVDIDEDELLAFVVKNAKKDEVGDFTEEEISYVVKGELAYCDSIDMFDE